MSNPIEIPHSGTTLFLAGATAGLITDVIYHPLDTIKCRMQASWKGQDFTKLSKGVSLYSGLSS